MHFTRTWTVPPKFPSLREATKDNFIGVLFSSSDATPTHRKSKLEPKYRKSEKKSNEIFAKKEKLGEDRGVIICFMHNTFLQHGDKSMALHHDDGDIPHKLSGISLAINELLDAKTHTIVFGETKKSLEEALGVYFGENMHERNIAAHIGEKVIHTGGFVVFPNGTQFPATPVANDRQFTLAA